MKQNFWLYSNSYLKFLGCTGLDENENHEQHRVNMVEDSTNDESKNSSRKTNDNITLQLNDKVFFFFSSIFGLLVFCCLGRGGDPK